MINLYYMTLYLYYLRFRHNNRYKLRCNVFLDSLKSANKTKRVKKLKLLKIGGNSLVLTQNCLYSLLFMFIVLLLAK